MERTKRLLGGALLALLLVGAQACDDNLTAPEASDPTTVCFWIDGVLQCIETD